MSSLYLRKGVFQIQYVEHGKVVQKSLRTKSLSIANELREGIDKQVALAEEARNAVGVATVGDLAEAYTRMASEYYRKGGEPTSQLWIVKTSVKSLTPYSSLLVSQFGPSNLKEMVRTWIDDGQARNTINKYLGQVKRIFRWGVAEQTVPISVYQALCAVDGLRAGRSGAKETEKVRPVLEAHIAAAKTKLPKVVCDMIDLQLLTAARPGEIVDLRPCDFDRSGAVWIVDLKDKHKTAHRGKGRLLMFGPKAQALLRPYFLARGPADYIFSPLEAIRQRKANCEHHRRPNQQPNPLATDRRVRACYDTRSYRNAVAVACRAYNAEAKAKGMPQIPVWHPHQLRHNAGTAIRNEHGVEVQRAALGQATIQAAEIYSEIDIARAKKVALEMG